MIQYFIDPITLLLFCLTIYTLEDFQKWSIPENTTTDKPVDKSVDKSVDFFVETRKTSQQNKSVVYPIHRIILQQ
jgi:hypothetical protein